MLIWDCAIIRIQILSFDKFVWSWLQLLVESLQNNNNINWIWKIEILHTNKISNTENMVLFIVHEMRCFYIY